MSDPFGPKLLAVQDTLPLGYVVNSPVDIEAASKYNQPGYGRWLAVDGKDRYRNEVDYRLSPQFAAGVFATTIRALAASPAAAVVEASPTYFVTSAAAGTTAGQYSTDGATWAQTTLVSPASCQVNSILWTGVRWVFGCSGSVHTCVTSGDNPNSTWTECTNDVATTLTQALAYSPTLAMTVMVPNGAGTSVYSLPDGSTTTTARTTTSASKIAICWTGTKFMIITNTAGIPLQTSTNGTAWTDAFMGGWSSTLSLSIASDGAGNIVVVFATYLLVSNDDGVTWRKVYPPLEFQIVANEAPATAPLQFARVTFTNNKFFLYMGGTSAGRVAVSAKGNAWAVEPIGQRGIASTKISHLAFKSNVYSGVVISTTVAVSATEDMGRFRMPGISRNQAQDTSGIASFQEYQPYVKVAM